MLRFRIERAHVSDKGIGFSLRIVSRALIIIFVIFAELLLAQWNTGVPKTRKEDVQETLHGVGLVDPYRWLEDQDSQETREWINAQNKYANSFLQGLPEREPMKQRLSELLKTDTFDVPTERGGRYFFSKRRAEQDLAVVYVRKGLRGADEVLLDPHPLSADHTISIDLLGISQDGTLVAYGVRQGGADEIEVCLMKIDTRQALSDLLPQGRYFGISIDSRKSGIYYSR